MNGKQNLDELLRSWPALAPRTEKGVIKASDDGDWEEWAEVIVKAAASAGPSLDPAALEALLGAPPLAPERDEPGDLVKISAGSGEIKMSDENDSGGALSGEASAPSTSTPPSNTPPPERKRSSLKAFAAQASSRPSSIAPPVVSAATSTPLPATVTPLPVRLSRPGLAPASRPTEASADDSGIVNLNLLNERATAQQIAAAEKAKPGTADLFEDDKPAEAEAKPAAAKVIPIGAAAPQKKNNNGAIMGIAIALIGVAAAFAIVKTQSAPTAPPVAVTDKAPIEATAKPEPSAAPVADPTAVAAVATVDPASTAAPTAAPEAGDAPKLAATAGALPSAVAVAAKDPAAEKLALAAKEKSALAGKPGDLQSEMARAVGAGDAPKPGHEGTPEPAAANPKGKNVPEQPSQGSVQAAIGTVMGGAKACVAGAPDVSRAQVTFGSSGAVQNVSVSGWAASNGKSGCVSAALKGAKVGPFSKPSFTVGVTIRP